MKAGEFLNSVTDCLDGGGYATTVVTYEDAITYADKRVIEELETMVNKFTSMATYDGSDFWKMNQRIKELKQ